MLSGTLDACEELKKDTHGFGNMLKTFGLPASCPVEKLRKCIDETQKLDISEYKSYLGLMNGDLEIQANMTHESVILSWIQKQFGI